MSDSQLTANDESLCNVELSSLDQTDSRVMHRVVFEISTVEQWYDILRDAKMEFGHNGFRSQGRVLRKLKANRRQRFQKYITTVYRHNNPSAIDCPWVNVPVWFEVPSLPWVFKILLKHGLNHKFVRR